MTIVVCFATQPWLSGANKRLATLLDFIPAGNESSFKDVLHEREGRCPGKPTETRLDHWASRGKKQLLVQGLCLAQQASNETDS